MMTPQSCQVQPTLNLQLQPAWVACSRCVPPPSDMGYRLLSGQTLNGQVIDGLCHVRRFNHEHARCQRHQMLG